MLGNLLRGSVSAALGTVSTNPGPAPQAMNALGLELLAKGMPSDANALLSPYSIQTALAMTYAGAEGQTRAEMASILHYPADEAELHRSFAVLQKALEEVTKSTTERAERAKKVGGPSEPITLTVANRLFGESSYAFRPAFLTLVKDTYKAPLQAIGFTSNPADAIQTINGWVEQETRRRIRDLIPSGGLSADTRLVLVNAIYLKAPWVEEFSASATRPAPFHMKGGPAQDVPTMVHEGHYGYAQREGFSVLTIPYSGGDVQFLILLPDKRDGLGALEAKVTPELLAACADVGKSNLVLHLPKFRIEPPLFRLAQVLQTLGMKSAFDQPKGSANFDRMAPRKSDGYLYISEIFHKTFLALDEKGTEAAAATAVSMDLRAAMQKPEPIDLRVDHPFLFAVQHRLSGACLFLGRVTEPR
jgi:serpin B